MRALYQLKCVRLEKADVSQREVKVLFSKFFMRTEAPGVPGKANRYFRLGYDSC